MSASPVREGKPPRRRRLRLFVRVAAAAILLIVAIRIVLPNIAFLVARNVLAGQGLALDWSDLDLSLAGGRVSVFGATLATSGAATPAVRLAFAEADVRVASLFSGRLVFENVEIDGLEIDVEREASGAVPLLDGFLAAAPSGASAEPTPAPAEAPGPLSLRLPVEVERLRIQPLRLAFTDRMASPPVAATIEITVRGDALGSSGEESTFSLRARSRQLLSSFSIDATARGDDATLAGHAAIEVSDLRLGPLAPYLRRIGIEPIADASSFRCDVRLAARADPKTRDTLSGEVELADAEFVADGETAFSLERAKAEIGSLGPLETAVTLAEASGLRAAIRKSEDGRLALLGLLVGGPVADSGPPAAPAAPAGSALPPVAWRVARAAIADGEVRFTDDSVAGSPELTTVLESLVVENAGTGDPWRLSAALRVADAVESIRVEGTASPLGPRRSAELAIAADGITLRSLEPHLRAAGLEPRFESGTLRIGVAATAETDSTGRVRGEVRVEPFDLRDGAERSLASFSRIVLLGVELPSPATGGSLVVGEATVAGPSLPVRRDAAGCLEALGFATVAPETGVGAAAGAERAAAPPPDATASASVVFPAIEIRRLTWDAGQVTFLDESSENPIDLRLASARIEIEGLAAGREPASARVSASVPGVAESVDVAARIAIAPDRASIRCEGSFEASGLTARAIAPILASVGIDVTALDATARARFEVALSRETSGALAVEGALSDLGFTQAGADVVALDSLALRGARFGADGTRIAAIEAGTATARLARDADGALRMGAVRFLKTSAPPPAAPDEPVRPASAQGASLAIDRIGLGSLALEWTDALSGEATSLAVSAHGAMEGLRIGSIGLEGPATFSLSLASPGLADALECRGTASLAPGGAGGDISFRLEGKGLRPQALGPYLPAGLGSAVADGRLRADVVASFGPAPEGGLRVEFAASGLDWRDGDSAEPLFAFEKLALNAPRVDPRPGGAIFVEEMSLAGLATSVFRHAPGGTTIAGLRFDPVESASPPRVVADAAGPSPAPPSPNVPNAPLPPHVRIETLSVGIARLSLDADGRPEGSPPLVASFEVAAKGPIDLFSPDGADPGPIAFELEGRAPSLFDSGRIDIVVEPFEDRPNADLTIAVTGIHGAGLLALEPGLGDRIDASELERGEFRARASAELVFPRRGPLDFALGGGFGAEIRVSECAFRAEPGGPVLAGVDELEIVLQRYSPLTGDVHVRTVRIETPRGRVTREETGYRALGVLFKDLPAAPLEPAPEGAPIPPPAPASSAARAPEFRIDSLQSSGVDFAFSDVTASPPLVVPLSEFDADVRWFSNRSAETNRPLQFAFSASAGQVGLPDGERSAFEELAFVGRVVPSARPTGFVKMNVSGFELMSLASEAKRSGITIGGGVLDASASIRFKGEKSTTVESRLVFDSLSLEEGANGPISRVLRLPASLDTVLFLLRDSNEQHQFTFDFDVPPGGVGAGAIAAHALTKFSEAIAKAVANSPFRVTGVVTNFLGITGGEPDEPLPTVVAEFAPGDAALGPAQEEKLREMVERLDDDGDMTVVLRHEIGPSDWAMAEERANPPAGAALEIATRLRRQRAAYALEQAEGAAVVRTLYASGRREEAEAAARSVREIEARAGECEAALEGVLALLSPRAERRKPQRTRAACVDLGTERLRSVREALVASGVSEIEERVSVRPARGGPVLESGAGRVLLVEKRRPAEPGLWDKIIETLMFWTWI